MSDCGRHSVAEKAFLNRLREGPALMETRWFFCSGCGQQVSLTALSGTAYYPGCCDSDMIEVGFGGLGPGIVSSA